jgi:hypothetical protein
MIAAGIIHLENGRKVQAYWYYSETQGLEMRDADGVTVFAVSDKEFIQLAEDYVTRPVNTVKTKHGKTNG